jgi:hypothetical protein
MKNKIVLIFAFIFVIASGNTIFGQATHTVDFETGGVGADWTWEVGENDDNPALEFVANPATGGINTSSMVAKFTARQTGNPWALVFTDDNGTFTFDASNSTVKIMVNKPEISPIHIKFEGPGTSIELIDSNSVVNQWEEITYDFSSEIGKTFNRLVIIPDFQTRAQENILYFDNIQLPEGQILTVPEPTDPAPTPTVPAGDVIAIFSDAYTVYPGTNLNPGWGQSTVFELMAIQGDTVMKYGNINYQGIELANSLNLDSAAMQYLHIDVWNANSTDFGVFLISPGPVEQRVALVPPAATETWTSFDIPLTDFTGVDLSDVFQMKFDGSGTLYVDNIYFTKTVTDVKEFQSTIPADFALEQNYPNPFNPSTNIRFNLPEAGNVTSTVYNTLGQEVAELVNDFMTAGSYEVTFEASDLPSGLYFYSISAGNFNSVRKMLLLK